MKNLFLLLLLFVAFTSDTWATVVLSDNFDDNSLDGVKWNETDSGSNISETGGKLSIKGDGANWNTNGIRSVSLGDYKKRYVATFDLTTPSTMTNFYAYLGLSSSSALDTEATFSCLLGLSPTAAFVYGGTAATVVGTYYNIDAATTYNIKIVVDRNIYTGIYIKTSSDPEYTRLYYFLRPLQSASNVYLHFYGYDSAYSYTIDNVSVDASESNIPWDVQAEGSFDGTNDYVKIDTLDGTSFPTSGTLCFFMTPTNFSGANALTAICNNRFTYDNKRLFNFGNWYGMGGMLVTSDNAATPNLSFLATNATFSNSTKYHIGIVWNSGTPVRKIFIDGVEDKTDSSSFYLPDQFSDFSMAASINSGAGWYFGGKVDDVCFFSGTELNGTQLTAIKNGTGDFTNCTYRWKCDELSWNGTTDEVKELIGSKHGTSVNGANTNVISQTNTIWSYKIIGNGDSIGYTGFGDVLASRITSSTYGDRTLTVLNKAHAGYNTDSLLSLFQSEIIDNKGQACYFIGATNDSYPDPPLTPAQTRANFLSMLAMCNAAYPPVKFIIQETAPVTNYASFSPPSALTDEQYQQYIKLRGAEERAICADYGLEFVAVYSRMARTETAYEDDLKTAYTIDGGLHHSDAAYQLEGDLFAQRKIPKRMYRWGHDSYANKTPENESWAWGILGGSASISGDADTGTATLPQNDTIDLRVVCLEAGTKLVSLSSATSAGTIEIYYRTSSSNFARDAATSWTLYTSPFITTDQFIQMRLKGTSVSNATATDAQMTWARCDSPKPIPTFMR